MGVAPEPLNELEICLEGDASSRQKKVLGRAPLYLIFLDETRWSGQWIRAITVLADPPPGLVLPRAAPGRLVLTRAVASGRTDRVCPLLVGC